MAQGKRVRKVSIPRFGSYLRSVRGKMKWGQIERRLKDIGREGAVLSGTLSMDEQGKTLDIGPDRLRLYAELYRTSYDTLVNEYVKDRFGVDLLNPKLSEELLYPDDGHAALHRDLQFILANSKRRTVWISGNIHDLRAGAAREADEHQAEQANEAEGGKRAQSRRLVGQ